MGSTSLAVPLESFPAIISQSTAKKVCDRTSTKRSPDFRRSCKPLLRFLMIRSFVRRSELTPPLSTLERSLQTRMIFRLFLPSSRQREAGKKLPPQSQTGLRHAPLEHLISKSPRVTARDYLGRRLRGFALPDISRHRSNMIGVKAVLTLASRPHVGVMLREGFDFLVGGVAARRQRGPPPASRPGL
jgi:hypothetical protein